MDGEETTKVAAKRRGPRTWVFPASIGILIVLFAVAMFQRNRIRAHWWAYRLNQVEDLSDEQLTFYASSLAAAGDDAIGAVASLTRNDRPEVRSLAVAVLGQLPVDSSVSLLEQLLYDADRDVRESSALTLAFLDDPRAEIALVKALHDDDPAGAAAAASGLGRVATGSAQIALAVALERHERPTVRAQAVESLAESLFAVGDLATGHAAGEGPDEQAEPVSALVGALDDTALFEGELTTERQVAAAAGFVASSTTLPVDFDGQKPSGRSVADVAAGALRNLSGEDVTVIERSPAEQAKLADALRGPIEARRRAASPGD